MLVKLLPNDPSIHSLKHLYFLILSYVCTMCFDHICPPITLSCSFPMHAKSLLPSMSPLLSCIFPNGPLSLIMVICMIMGVRSITRTGQHISEQGTEENDSSSSSDHQLPVALLLEWSLQALSVMEW